LLGVFIGLVLGLALAAGVAYYLMGGSNPYQANARPEASRDSGKLTRSDPPAEKPKFDFYKILPGGEEPKLQADRKAPDRPDRSVAEKALERSTAKGADGVAERVPEKAPVRTAAADTEAKAPKAGEKVWLQAGSFANEADAENLKARLALAGFEAGVQQGTLADKSVRFRVRLGPYDNTDEIARVRGRLAKEGIDVAVIRN
jgi:cell division protein FtsN